MDNQKSAVSGVLGLGVLGLGVLIGSVVIALDQLATYGTWETEQMFNPFHHEGIALWGLITGTALVGIATLKAGEKC